MTYAPGAAWQAWEVGWHLYDHDERNPLHNREEVERLKKVFASAAGKMTG